MLRLTGIVVKDYYKFHLSKYRGKKKALTSKISAFGNSTNAIQVSTAFHRLEFTTYNAEFKKKYAHVVCEPGARNAVVGRDTIFRLLPDPDEPPCATAKASACSSAGAKRARKNGEPKINSSRSDASGHDGAVNSAMDVVDLCSSSDNEEEDVHGNHSAQISPCKRQECFELREKMKTFEDALAALKHENDNLKARLAGNTT